jgi:hypothetical protein
MTGEWPKQEIDHINGVRTDNFISNLREADRWLNCQNIRQAPSSSSTGLMGVYFDKRSRMWVASIIAYRKKHYLGRFSTPEEGHAVYLLAKRRLHDGCTI